MQIDEIAKYDALKRYGIPECLHIPIAAKNKDAITKYVGDIIEDLSNQAGAKAFLVKVLPPVFVDQSLAIWKVETSPVLHAEFQCWVDVDYKFYRGAYRKAFPDEEIGKSVLDHVMNRKIARLQGFQYLRIIPISRGANSSSGRAAERLGVEYHSSDYIIKINAEKNIFIKYADIADLIKMLDIQTGGGIMYPVNSSQSLLEPLLNGIRATLKRIISFNSLPSMIFKAPKEYTLFLNRFLYRYPLKKKAPDFKFGTISFNSIFQAPFDFFTKALQLSEGLVPIKITKAGITATDIISME